MRDYTFKTPPFTHQRQTFEATWDREAYAIFWEQGTGKSKLIVDTAAALFLAGKITGVLILAPNGVHLSWILDQLPAHCPVPYVAHAYQSSRAKTVGHQQACAQLLRTPELAVLTMSYDAIITEVGKATAKKFLTTRRCLEVLDEATRIKTPGAKRTKTVLASGQYAPYRRILTGTPVANSPFDVYAPMKFIEPDYWRTAGLASYAAFKSQFGVWAPMTVGDRSFDRCVGYKNLEWLHQLLQPASSRVVKTDVLDLPPKLYATRTFELNATQRRLYDQLKQEFLALLDSGEYVEAPLAIVRLLRLQQITCGYVPTETGEPPVDITPHDNVRLQTLLELCEDLPHPTIIWARFRRDIDLICAALDQRQFGPVYRYDGAVSDAVRRTSVEQFQTAAPGPRFFVGNPAAGAEGLTLHAAQTVIYYSNSFKLTERLQSEDRAHRIGQCHPVNYIDLVARDTVDRGIHEALLTKQEIAAAITGDRLYDWLRPVEGDRVVLVPGGVQDA